MRLDDEVRSPADRIEERELLARLLVRRAVLDAAPREERERACHRQAELHVVARVVVAAGQVEPDIAAVAERGVPAPWDAEVRGNASGALRVVEVQGLLQRFGVVEVSGRACGRDGDHHRPGRGSGRVAGRQRHVRRCRKGGSSGDQAARDVHGEPGGQAGRAEGGGRAACGDLVGERHADGAVGRGRAGHDGNDGAAAATTTGVTATRAAAARATAAACAVTPCTEDDGQVGAVGDAVGIQVIQRVGASPIAKDGTDIAGIHLGIEVDVTAALDHRRDGHGRRQHAGHREVGDAADIHGRTRRDGGVVVGVDDPVVIAHARLHGAVPRAGDVGGPVELQCPALDGLVGVVGDVEEALPATGPLVGEGEGRPREGGGGGEKHARQRTDCQFHSALLL